MAFGFGMGFRFGSRQGGGASAFALTPDNVLDAFPASAFTRAGTAEGRDENRDPYTVSANEPALSYIPEYGAWALHVRRAVTNLCTEPNNLAGTGWVASNVTPSNQTTHSRLTATADNGTMTFALTKASAAHIGQMDVRRISGTGTISISINGGSTYADLEIGGGFDLRWSSVVTAANPSLVIKIGSSGDVFDVRRVGLLAASAPYFPFAPVGSAAAETLRTTMAAPSSFALTYLAELLASYAGESQYLVGISAPSTYYPGFYSYWDGPTQVKGATRLDGAATPQANNFSAGVVTAGYRKVEEIWSSVDGSTTTVDETETKSRAALSGSIAGATVFCIGNRDDRWNASNRAVTPILALRCPAAFGLPFNGFNQGLL